jgi:7-carboxy-7-deazaguanine synthase
MIPISEIFGPTIQGEGDMIGVPTVFVRTGGCDYRCSWCDTKYAVDTIHAHTWNPMSPEQITDKVKACSPHPCTVTFSGGNPAMHDMGAVVDLLHASGYTVAVETQGSIFMPWLNRCDLVTVSPKPPSSANPTHPVMFENFLRPLTSPRCIKVVIMNDADFDYAISLLSRFQGMLTLQPCNQWVGQADADYRSNTTEGLLRVAEKVMCHPEAIRMRVLPQLHLWLYGMKRGV